MTAHCDTYENDLKEHFLVNLHEFLIPLIDIGGLFSGIRIILSGWCRVPFVMSAPLDHLIQDSLVDLHDRGKRTFDKMVGC